MATEEFKAKAEEAIGKVSEKLDIAKDKLAGKARGAREKLHQNELAQKATKKAFKQCDIDGSGKLDAAELYVGILLVYDKINKVCPVYIKIPSKKEVLSIMKKHDIDSSGQLTEEEFDEVVMDLLAGHSDSWHKSIWFRVASSIALKLLIFPTIGWGLKEGLDAAGIHAIRKVPTSVLTMASSMAVQVGIMKLANPETDEE